MAYRNWLTAGALCVAMAFAVYFYALSPGSADGQAMILPVDPTPLVAETGSGERSFSIEIADTSDEREAGLMFRKDMADDHGMLFVFETPGEVTFWMKNTPMPLDLVFVGQDGKIKAIKRGEPESEAIIPAGQPVSFVLELKAGTAAKDGLKDGDLLRHPVIAKASGTSSN
ncbi:DUF192 domain-containing protein [Mesorhizobium sp. VK24D]|uniref:DUF192 domain-containing protein n=1 Tax=Mesorhizobium album TaxID=3072314 RepID=A0ABU4XVP7_9HYPH|nr:DUF192 domain-containing protein [Mesorhizobium sp. VK24D]MDX8478769.1 DUF192 domain-containing protein [Mesorhizobium sp. VK24D]